MNSSEGYVIHQQLSGETSVYVTFFTRERGLFKALYKGGRSLKKQATLQAFTSLWISFQEKKERYYIQTIELKAPTYSLKSEQLFSGMYINELLYLALYPNESYEELFIAYGNAISALSNAVTRTDIEKILRRFEWCWLETLGYALSLTHDAKTCLPIILQAYYELEPGLGFIEAKKGILGEHILDFKEFKFDSIEVLKSAKKIMRQAINHALGGKSIQSRNLFIKSNISVSSNN